MDKVFYILYALIGEKEYVQYRDLTIEHCVARMYVERQALFNVQEVHPKMKANFECREQ